METKKKKKTWLIIVIVAIVLVVVIAAVAVISKVSKGMESFANMVQVEEVKTRDLSDYISFTGSISGESRTNVMSKASGEVLTVNVQVGDTVSAGDELVILDDTELKKQIAELEKQIGNVSALAKNEASIREQNLIDAKAERDDMVNSANEAVKQAQKQVDDVTQELNTLNASIESKIAEYNEINEEISFLKEQKEECEAILAEAQSALAEAKDNYKEAATNGDRAVSAAQNEIDMAKYQEDGTADIITQLEEMREQLKDCKLTAPCGGVVTAVNVSVGDSYGGGMTMITIENTNALKVIVEVKEADILRLSEGMKAIIKTTATGEKEIPGTVTRVVRVKNQSVDMEGMGGTGGYSAEITIEDADVLIGMSASAKVILQEKKDVLAIPYDLIKYDEEGNAYVLVAEDYQGGESIAVRKNITVGEEVDYYTEVLGGELQAGDLLIYDYLGMIEEGSTFVPEQNYFDPEMGIYEDETDVEVYY